LFNASITNVMLLLIQRILSQADVQKILCFKIRNLKFPNSYKNAYMSDGIQIIQQFKVIVYSFPLTHDFKGSIFWPDAVTSTSFLGVDLR